MNESLLRGAVAISGVGTAGCGDASGFTDMEILAKAARSAVHDAGLKMSDIDGIATANLSAALWPLNVVEYLNVRPSYVDGTNIGGTSFIGHMLPAARALMSGQCNAVLVCYGSTQRSTRVPRRERADARALLDPLPYEAPYEPFNPPSSYALIAARHMHEYGTTRRQLAEVAVAARRWAQLNPEAFARDPLSLQDVLSARDDHVVDAAGDEQVTVGVAVADVAGAQETVAGEGGRGGVRVVHRPPDGSPQRQRLVHGRQPLDDPHGFTMNAAECERLTATLMLGPTERSEATRRPPTDNAHPITVSQAEVHRLSPPAGWGQASRPGPRLAACGELAAGDQLQVTERSVTGGTRRVKRVKIAEVMLQKAGPNIVDPHGGADGLGGDQVVSGEHHDVLAESIA